MRKKYLLFILMLMVIPVSVKAQPANSKFKDDVFYECIINSMNSQGVNEKSDRTTSYAVTDDELSKLTVLSCNKKDSTAKVRDFTGLDVMTNLVDLRLQYNEISSIDVSKLVKLEYLDLGANKLTNVDVSKNTNLAVLSVSANQLTGIDVSKNPNLTHLDLNDNKITNIDVSKNTKLTELYLGNNKLTSIDVSKNINLKELFLYGNQLTTLDVSKNTALEILKIKNNKFNGNVDVSKNTKLVTYEYDGYGSSDGGSNTNKNPNTGIAAPLIIGLVGLVSLSFGMIAYVRSRKKTVSY